MRAAFEALRTKGFAGASARAIAAIADVNPGLIFYYFESLDALLLAALRESNEARLERYRSAAEQVRTAGELVALLREIYRDDMRSGQVRVVCEMVAGSVARPELAEQVMELMEPWVQLAEDAVQRVLGDLASPMLPSARELALGGVTYYLGANLLTHMGQAPDAVDGLLAKAEHAAAMIDLVAPGRD